MNYPCLKAGASEITEVIAWRVPRQQKKCFTSILNFVKTLFSSYEENLLTFTIQRFLCKNHQIRISKNTKIYENISRKNRNYPLPKGRGFIKEKDIRDLYIQINSWDLQASILYTNKQTYHDILFTFDKRTIIYCA